MYFNSDEVYVVLKSKLIYEDTHTFSSIFPHKYFNIWVYQEINADETKHEKPDSKDLMNIILMI